MLESCPTAGTGFNQKLPVSLKQALSYSTNKCSGPFCVPHSPLPLSQSNMSISSKLTPNVTQTGVTWETASIRVAVSMGHFLDMIEGEGPASGQVVLG